MTPPDIPDSESPPIDQPTGCLGKLFALLGVFVSGIWLLNFSFGIDGDALPIIGNLDEALATTILIYCLSRLGINTSWLTRSKSMSVAKKTK